VLFLPAGLLTVQCPGNRAIILVLMSKSYRCTYVPVFFLWFILQIVVDLAFYKEAEPLL